MSAFFKSLYSEQPRLRSARYRFGMLAFIIALIICELVMFMQAPHRPSRLLNLVIGFGLLFNHLAFQFRWSQFTNICLRSVAIIWIFFALACLVNVLKR